MTSITRGGGVLEQTIFELKEQSNQIKVRRFVRSDKRLKRHLRFCATLCCLLFSSFDVVRRLKILFAG